MDGNRRWAQTHGLPPHKGHERGFETLRKVVDWCKEKGVQHLVVYAFSTENRGRAEEEVAYIMDLGRKLLRDESPKLVRQGVSVHVIGDVKRFPVDIQEMIHDIQSKQVSNAAHHLWVAASYGGRAEILHAVNALLNKNASLVDEEGFTNELWTSGMPDPDLVIRTGGEQRLSNFLPWQTVYSELFFVPTYWPDFTKEVFEDILTQYAQRERRYGK